MSTAAPHAQVTDMKVDRPGPVDHDRAKREMRIRARTFKPYDCEYDYTGGKVKALFIGINYFNSPAVLDGCCNDVKTMLDMLKRVEFPIQEAAILVDDPSVASFVEPPTRGNIIRYMAWLTADVSEGDVLFLHYSGHGAQTKAVKDSEEEAYDQCIVPLDYLTDGCILDNDLFKALVDPLPLGARLTCVFDCCHSASLLDMPYKIAASDTLQADGHKYRMDQVRQDNFSTGDVISFSGCTDDGKSSDVRSSEGAGGAATAAFTWCVENEHGADYLEVLVKTREALKEKGFTQVPQLSCSKPLDMNKPFSLFGDLTVDELQFQESAPSFFNVCSAHAFNPADPEAIPPQFRHHLMHGYDPAAIRRRFSQGHAVIKPAGPDTTTATTSGQGGSGAVGPSSPPLPSGCSPPSPITHTTPPQQKDGSNGASDSFPTNQHSPKPPRDPSHSAKDPCAVCLRNSDPRKAHESVDSSGRRTARPAGRPPSGELRRSPAAAQRLSPIPPPGTPDAGTTVVASSLSFSASASPAPPIALEHSPNRKTSPAKPPKPPTNNLLSPVSDFLNGSSGGRTQNKPPNAAFVSPLMEYVNLTTLLADDVPLVGATTLEPAKRDDKKPTTAALPAVKPLPAYKVPARKATTQIAKPKVDPKKPLLSPLVSAAATPPPTPSLPKANGTSPTAAAAAVGAASSPVLSTATLANAAPTAATAATTTTTSVPAKPGFGPLPSLSHKKADDANLSATYPGLSTTPTKTFHPQPASAVSPSHKTTTTTTSPARKTAASPERKLASSSTNVAAVKPGTVPRLPALNARRSSGSPTATTSGPKTAKPSTQKTELDLRTPPSKPTQGKTQSTTTTAPPAPAKKPSTAATPTATTATNNNTNAKSNTAAPRPKPSATPVVIPKLPDLSKKVFALDGSLTVHKFVKSIYGQIELEIGSVNAHLVLGAGENCPPSWLTLSELYALHRDAEDGLLYVRYTTAALPGNKSGAAAGCFKTVTSLSTRKLTAESGLAAGKVPVVVEALTAY